VDAERARGRYGREGRGGGEWPPDELEQFKETEATLQRALPPAELDHARTEGAAMSREQAVAYALSLVQP
jgi:hypothetical protein